jgi:IclR family acetate operon transcriptional repressor
MMRNRERTVKTRRDQGERAGIQSVERAVSLLLLVASGATDGTGKALAGAAGLAVPTAHHLLRTLVTQGLLARDANARYLLGPKIGILADAFQHDLSVPEYLLGPLQQLAVTTGETTYLAGWRNGGIQIIAKVEGNLPVRVSLPTGGPYRDAHARAAGKVMLAYAPARLRERYLLTNPLRPLTPRTLIDTNQLEVELERVRGSGYAIDEEEFLTGVGCVAVPVLQGDMLVAAYGMSVPMQRFEQRREELIRALVSTARSIERTLANAPGRQQAPSSLGPRVEAVTAP